MVCQACGRSTQNENANYCEYCGTSFRENRNVLYEDVEKENVKETVKTNEIQGDAVIAEEKVISFKNWLGSMILPFIPFVGFLIYIVMLFVWSFSSETPKSKKNWARATLVVGVIAFILLAYFLMSTTMDLINSGFDFNGYIEQINSMYK